MFVLVRVCMGAGCVFVFVCFAPACFGAFAGLRPLTSRNFLELAKSGHAEQRLQYRCVLMIALCRYYDGCIVHRVVPGFMCPMLDSPAAC